MNQVHESVAELMRVLSASRIGYRSELLMQSDVAKVLAASGVEYANEVVLSARDRIDFVCLGNVGLECKVSGSFSSVASQLIRYAEHSAIESLILVTSRASHRKFASQTHLLGKPFYVVFVAFGSL